MRFTAPLVAFLIFITFYAWLQRRSGAPIQWGWLAAIVLCAGVALAAGFLI